MLIDQITSTRQIGKGKSGVSYLVTIDGRQYVYKQMHDEEVSYYDFTGEKIELEVNAYKVLLNTIIRIPRLIEHDVQQKYLIKEYIEGKTVVELITQAQVDDNLFKEMLLWERELKAKSINIDYFPDNFVLGNEGLYYIDYEYSQYSEEWDFTNWGIYYWINRQGFMEFMKTNNGDYINEKGTGIPIKTEEIRKERERILGLR